MQSVLKPMVTSIQKGARSKEQGARGRSEHDRVWIESFFEDPLMGISLGAIGEEGDDGAAAGSQALGNLERRRGSDSGRACGEQAFGPSERPAGFKSRRVVDRDHTVDGAAVEDLWKEGEPDPLDFVRSSLSAAQDRSLGFGGHALEPRNPLPQKAGGASERSGRADAANESV